MDWNSPITVGVDEAAAKANLAMAQKADLGLDCDGEMWLILHGLPGVEMWQESYYCCTDQELMRLLRLCYEVFGNEFRISHRLVRDGGLISRLAADVGFNLDIVVV